MGVVCSLHHVRLASQGNMLPTTSRSLTASWVTGNGLSVVFGLFNIVEDVDRFVRIVAARGKGPDYKRSAAWT